ncbi:MAG: hypothetical protein L0Y54_02760 [Sporichthyaceae bacterium]|nr:hypothetical protein [Sporichthyaceae bacterium]
MYPAAGVSARQHQHTTGLLGRLNAEWSELVGTPASRAAVTAWRRREPGLAGLSDLAAIETAVRSRSERADVDELLLALLRQAASPDAPWADLAGRTVLQLMLPKAVAIARSQRGRMPDPDERISAVVACLYETIRGYPVERRQHSVAGNLGLDTLHLLQRRTGRSAADELLVDPADPLFEPAQDAGDPLAGLLSCLQRALDLQVIDAADEAVSEAREACSPVPSSRGLLLELLVWAVEQRVLVAADAALLARAYSAQPLDDRALAARLGCGRSTVCKRRLRAIRALRAAAAEFLAAQAAVAA